MTPDYSQSLIDARKQLANAEAAAALHDYARAIIATSQAYDSVLLIWHALYDLETEQLGRQNAQRAT